MNSDPKSLPRGWLVVALLCVVGLLNYLDRGMITTMRVSVKAAIPMTEAQFGALTSVFLWTYGLLSPFAGFVADRFSRTRVIIVSLFCWSLVTWLMAQATSFDQLFVCRAIMGVSEACYMPAALALIADYHRGSTRSLATGTHLSGSILGSSFGGLGGWLAENHSWNFPFTVFGLAGVGYSIALLAALRDAPRETASASAPAETAPRVRLGEALASLFGRRSFWIAIIYWSLLGLSGWAVVGWMPTYIGEQFQLPQGKAGLMATLFTHGAMLIGFVTGGVWADRWQRTHPRARILVPIIGLCVAAPAIAVVSLTPLLPCALAGLVAYGLARAFADGNMMPIVCLISDPRYRATAYGVLSLFGSIVGGLTVYLGGVLRDAHVNIGHVFQFAAAGLAVCAVILHFIQPTPEEKSA